LTTSPRQLLDDFDSTTAAAVEAHVEHLYSNSRAPAVDSNGLVRRSKPTAQTRRSKVRPALADGFDLVRNFEVATEFLL
jgi:hypothetical protein